MLTKFGTLRSKGLIETFVINFLFILLIIEFSNYLAREKKNNTMEKSINELYTN